jgi:hypothetical protein
MTLAFAQNYIALARLLFILRSVRFIFDGNVFYIITLASVSNYIKGRGGLF